MSNAFVPASGPAVPGPAVPGLAAPQLAQLPPRISQFATPNYRVTLGRSLRSELRKILTLPSLRWTLIIGTLFSLAITALTAWGSSELELNTYATAMGAEHSLAAYVLISASSIFQIIMVAFGAVTVCSEYAANTMRSTVSADPRRWRNVAARTLALSLVALATSLLLLVLGAVVGTLFGLTIGFSGDAWWLFLNFIIAMVTSAWMALGIGYLLRSSAGTIVLILAVMMLSPVLALIPSEFVRTFVIPYLPPMLLTAALSPPGLNAGADVASFTVSSPALGLGLWCALAVVLLALGGWRFSRSDV